MLHRQYLVCSIGLLAGQIESIQAPSVHIYICIVYDDQAFSWRVCECLCTYVCMCYLAEREMCKGNPFLLHGLSLLPFEARTDNNNNTRKRKPKKKKTGKTSWPCLACPLFMLNVVLQLRDAILSPSAYILLKNTTILQRSLSLH